MEHKSTCFEPCLEKKLKGHKNSITSLFYSPNEQQIATGSLDNSVLLWDLRGNMRSYRFQGHDEAVMDVTFSPSGKFMASASRDRTVRLWVPTVTGSTGMFKAHSQTVRSVQFSPDGSKIITASDDKIVKLWSSDKLKFLASFVGHTNWVRCARMSNDGSVIASCSDDKTARLWSSDTGECIHTYRDQKGHGMYLAWHPTGCYVAIGTSNGTIRLYDVRTHNLVQYYSIHNEAVSQLAFHPSGSFILTASKDGKMKILDLLEGSPIFTVSGHVGAVNAVNFSMSGDAFGSAGEDKLVFVWKTNFTELASEVKENVTQNHTCPSKSASQTSKFSCTTGKNQGTRIWYLCYHSIKYPVITFIHDDDNESTQESVKLPCFQEEPNANSTFVGPSHHSQINSSYQRTSSRISMHHSTNRTIHSNYQADDCSSNSVGHISHIPRPPPSPGTYTLPSILNKSIITYDHEEDLFGMVKLKENDVCYTSGTIEWVGRKRSYPINSGFKILNEKHTMCHENFLKKVKKLGNTFTCGEDKFKECDCADVLPTVNAIVDHLNALHEAVDLVDLRLNTLEDVVSRKHK